MLIKLDTPTTNPPPQHPGQPNLKSKKVKQTIGFSHGEKNIFCWHILYIKMQIIVWLNVTNIGKILRNTSQTKIRYGLLLGYNNVYATG